VRKFGAFVLAVAVVSILASCQSVPPIQTPVSSIQRGAATPLVAAVSGLNIPPLGDQRYYYGDLNNMLADIGIPSVIVLYDTQDDSVRSVANLSSEERSLAVLRVLPRLATAISQENKIRAAQGLPPLKNLELVGYSQGGVLIWDLVRRLVVFEAKFQDFKDAIGGEWEQFSKDPIYEALNDAVFNYFLIYNVQIQAPKTFEKYIDLQNLFYRAQRNMDKAIERITSHLRPETGSSPYPKIVKWLDESYERPKDIHNLPELLTSNIFVQYAAFRYLLPLDVRFFSIASSFYGAQMANKADFYEKVAPRLTKKFTGVRYEQIKDTRLGSRHHLDWTKQIFEFRQIRDEPYLDDLYFIVGVNGRHGQKGDGFVEQPAAHVSQHSVSQIPLKTVLSYLEKGDADDLKLEWTSLPDAPVTGLGVRHLGKKGLIFSHLGAGEMAPESKVWPFLSAFVQNDEEELERLHESEHIYLRQFMVSVYLPVGNSSLKFKDFKLEEFSEKTSNGVKLARPYYNAAANSITWIGVLEDAWTPSDKSDDMAEVTLKINSRASGKGEIHFPVFPGRIHFIEMTD